MNRHRTLTNSFHEQLDNIKSTSLPQMKQFIQKRIAKCKIPTINRMMKRSLMTGGYSSSKTLTKHSESDYEFGWGSDFDDDDNDDDFDDEIVDDEGVYEIEKLTNSNQDDLQFNEQNDKEMFKTSPISRHTRRPISDPPPPPLPKCPPPDLLEEAILLNSATSSKDNFYETLSAKMDNCSQIIDNSDYLMPNIPLRSSDKIKPGFRSSPNITSVTDRPLPPIPRYQYIQNDDIFKNHPWFLDIERDESEILLRRCNINGGFLVRKSKRAGICMPYTLTLYFNHRIFHLNIRIRPDQQFALGTEKLKEKTFRTIADLIEHHYHEPIYLTSRGMIAGKTTLISMPFGYQ